MESLYHQTSRQNHDIQNDLGRLERAGSDGDVHILENEIQNKIDQVISSCERLEILVNKEPPTRRATAKLKVDQLKYDCQHLQAALRNMQRKRYQKEEEAREREALLSRDFAPNDADTSIMMDHALQHNTGLNNANREVSEMINSGSNILTNMREQRVTLKGAHKKILDVANTLGLSNTVLRLIERRTTQDKFILYGGMIFTLIVMFIIWTYLA